MPSTNTKFSFESYMDKAYARVALSAQEHQTIKALGVAVASTPEELTANATQTQRSSATALPIHHIGITADQLNHLKAISPDLAQRIAAAHPLHHPQQHSARVRSMFELSEQELIDELAYERERAAWVAHSTPADHQCEQDREDHRIYFALPDSKYGIKPYRAGIQVRVEQIERTIEEMRELDRQAQTDPMLAGLHWEHKAENNILTRYLKDEHGYAWARSDSAKNAIEAARLNRLRAQPAHTITQSEFTQSCICISAVPGSKRALIDDHNDLSKLRLHFGNLYDRLKESSLLATDSTRDQWITHSITSILDTSPSSQLMYFSNDDTAGTTLTTGRIIRTAPGTRVRLAHLHEAIVEQALEKGIDVPERVLADYPHLTLTSRERFSPS